MEFYRIDISFPLPYQAPYWRVKPADFLSHFIGHEGSGSLHAYLKNKGWITSLSSWADSWARGFSTFKLSVSLTKSGFGTISPYIPRCCNELTQNTENYRDALLACYKYINLLRSSLLEVWVYDELKSLADLDFRFTEKSESDDYVVWLSNVMKDPVSRSLALSSRRLFWSWDEELVRNHFNCLSIEESRVFVIAKDHIILGKTGPWSQEPIYKTEYMVERLEADLLAAVSIVWSMYQNAIR